jgi:hypothetical protein
MPKNINYMDEAELAATPEWMKKALQKNPSYNGWDPGDDYMKGTAAGGSYGGWDAGIEYSADQLGNFGWDELNLLVNFHFTLTSDIELNLVLWVIHPRKGASRGVVYKNLSESDLPKAMEVLETGRKNHRQSVWSNLKK